MFNSVSYLMRPYHPVSLSTVFPNARGPFYGAFASLQLLVYAVLEARSCAPQTLLLFSHS